MDRPIRIGNAHGFWGDRLDAPAEILAQEPDLDFLTLDFLAEVSMSVLALQRSRDPQAGWPRDFLTVVRSIAPYWRGGGRCRIITNAGGLDPLACAQACCDALQEAGCSGRTIAAMSGDDVLDILRAEPADSPLFCNLDTGEPIVKVRDRLVTANAYLGAQPIAEALAQGADLVITGRVADPSLTVAPCAWFYDWSWDDWDRLAGATVAGHLIECGTQVTGGISTDWLQVPEVGRIGFPIVEVAGDGSCVVTKPRGAGGRVNEATVKEQLIYEIGNPEAYLSPDVTVSFLSFRVEDQGRDRVRVFGARGRSAPPSYKVSATYQDGFRAQGQLTVVGREAVAKARRAAAAVLERLKQTGTELRETLVECLGAGACLPQGIDPGVAGQLTETVLRIAVADDSHEAVERFSRELMPLVTAGPQGTTGYAEGRPRVHPLFRFWPCLVECAQVQPRVELLRVGEGKGETRATLRHPLTPGPSPRKRGEGRQCSDTLLAPSDTLLTRSDTFSTRSDTFSTRSDRLLTPDPDNSPLPLAGEGPGVRAVLPTTCDRLGSIALARSGDKGIHANIGVIARRPGDYARLCRELTPQRVASYFGISNAARVERYELPNLGALNFVLHGILANPLRTDAQGKALGQTMLEMPLEMAAIATQDTTSVSPVPGGGNGDPVLLVDRPDDATAVLTLNRPERRNALTIDLMQSLCHALESLAAEPSRRAVILRGAGPAFCSGLDLAEAARSDLAEASAHWVARTLETLVSSPLVTIAAAHGSAYAGGAGLMACCDFAVAADNLRICFPEVRRGLAPALVAAILHDRLRDADLRELLLLAEPIGASRALQMGLVHRVVPAAEVEEEARRLSTALLQAGPEALRHTKRLLHDFHARDLKQRFSRALETHQQARRSAESQERLAAFRDKRDAARQSRPACGP